MTKNEILILSGEDVKKTLTMTQAIDAMKEAFVQLSSGEADVPLRTHMEMPEAGGASLFMPVHLPGSRRIGLKVVNLFKDNPAKGLPVIHAVVMVIDGEDGRPLAVIDGEYLTALRTGAASGLATDLLARKDARTAAIIGAGVQGRTQLEAVCAVRKIDMAHAIDPNQAQAKKFASEMSEHLSIPVKASGSVDVLKTCDVICTATPASTPVFADSDLVEGVHINGVGSYRPDTSEIPAGTVARARVIVDSREACLAEAGDIVQPLRNGLITKRHIAAEIGEIAAGRCEGRQDNTEITFFKSVGNAAQDLAAANHVLDAARRMNLGVTAYL